jgi:ABC-type methionine transport system ATPase subunit
MTESEVTVKLVDVSIRVADAWVLDRVTFECCAGEWTLLYGPSGAGKSTLLRAINGLRPPTRGRIWTLGTAIPGRSRGQARDTWQRTGTLLQEIALFETKTARDNVALALRSVGIDRAAARTLAAQWLERLKLADKVDEYPAHLSGGERQRVALARALAVRPRLLVLDEPTSALDRATARLVLEAVRELVEQGSTVVMSSHRVDEICELCDQRIGLQNGRVSDIERLSNHARAVAHGLVSRAS